MKRRIFLLVASLVSVTVLQGCGPVGYIPRYEGIADPAFDLGQVTTIGLTPYYWTTVAKTFGVTQLEEKQLLNSCKIELERRGFQVEYIPEKNLKQIGDPNGPYVCEVHCFGMEKYPDLTCTVGYFAKRGTVTVPGESHGTFSFGPYGGSGWSSAHSSYDVSVWTLGIRIGLWAGPPEYMQEVWRGTVVQGSPQSDLPERAESMIDNLFARKFPVLKRTQ